MKLRLFGIAVLLAAASCNPSVKDGIHTIELLSTNDVHGAWFDSTYVNSNTRTSLLAINAYADSIRAVAGEDNVLLVDVGDALQGDNAAYYFNYVDTDSPHLYPRMVSYMKYDAAIVGNHDIETGHPVYDRIASDMKKARIPYLGGNAIRLDNGKAYFPASMTTTKAGLKVAVLGFTNANMKAWLSEEIWRGMTFESLLPLVQEEVDRIIRKEKPHVVVVGVHSGTGDGSGSILESQGLDLFNSLKGVDFLLTSHDHRPAVIQKEDICLINAGNRCRFLGHGTIKLEVKDGKIISKELSAETINVDPSKADARMRAEFQKEYETVKAFTTKKVGTLEVDIKTLEAFTGQSDYLNLLHKVCLGCAPARISIAAPLAQNSIFKAGDLLYHDLSTIYPYENQLFVINMSGKEVKDFLEYSYNKWIGGEDGHILNIAAREDKRNDLKRWSFKAASYNFDSAAGINYTVDVYKPFGERVSISGFADGTPFSLEETYPVAMTSYRANGGGDTLPKGAGISNDMIEERIVAKYPEIRNLIYDYLKENKTINHEAISDKSVIGSWSFIPAEAQPILERDLALLFPERKF